jgi:hypothetical protein
VYSIGSCPDSSSKNLSRNHRINFPFVSRTPETPAYWKLNPSLPGSRCHKFTGAAGRRPG